jgi:uncharacterized sulfatase
MAKEPMADRTARDKGFQAFRATLADQGKVPPIDQPPRRHAKVPVRKPADRVNVLWLMADQLRWDTLGFMNHPACKTPNLDKLAAEGCVFTTSCCTEPVCQPSRAAMLTGRYPYATGVLQNGYTMRDAEVVFPTLISQAGYRTANIGKQHCGRSGKETWEWNAHVEDVFGATKPSKVPFDPSIYPDVTFIADPEDNSDRVLYGRYPGPVQTSKSYLLANEAIKWLYWHDDPRPFFLRVSFDDPHPPIVPPEPFYSMYSPDDVPDELIEGQIESMRSKPETLQAFWRFTGKDRISLEDHRRHAACYFGLVSHLDAQMGRVLDYLDELGLRDNTLVLLNSDHGNMIGEHGLTHKGVGCHEGVLRIPTVFRWPGRLPAGLRTDALAEGVDVMPTLLDLLGIDVPDTVHGRSLAPILDGQVQRVRDHAFFQWEDYVFGVRDDRWKLTWYDPDQAGELYDLADDPLEKVNRYDDPESADHRDRLLGVLNDWRAVYARDEDHPRLIR